MRVICVKVGNKYGAEWVRRLRKMVDRHLSGHKFVCMTDKPVTGIECVEAPPLEGWWAKVGLFEPGKFPGDNLYLDLDIVITGALEFLEDRLDKEPDKLHVRDDFSYSVIEPTKSNPQLGYHGTVNSSVMLWRGDAVREVWDEFTPHEMSVVHGDQNWITRCLHPKGKISFLPNDKILSYKYHIQRGHKPAAVTVFHGEPKVTQLSRRDPLRAAWED